MATIICEGCGNPAHRSKVRNIRESFIKFFSNYRLYSCHKCGERQWVSRVPSKKPGKSPFQIKTIFIYLAFLAATIVFAFYWVDSMVKKTQTPSSISAP